MRRPPAAYVRLCLCAGLATTACRPATPPRPPLTSVRITVVPATGGSAEFEVSRDGTMRGGHLSGDSVPFVHQEAGRLASAVVDSLWSLAATLDSGTANARPPAGRGYAALQLTFGTNVTWVTSWPDTAQPVEPALRPLVNWLLAHRIGAW